MCLRVASAKSGNRIRITGQLIDAANATHLWADRFDGVLEDVFELQDRVTANVVGIIAPRVVQAETERARIKPAGNLEAYDLVLRAVALMRTLRRPEVEQALGLLRQAVQIDPSYARGMANLSLCCWIFIGQGFGHRDNPLVADMIELARMAVALDPADSEVLAIAAATFGVPGDDMETGLALVEKAIGLNRNNANAFRVSALLCAFKGEIERAVEHQQQAERLNPLDLGWTGTMAYPIAYFGVGDHEKVVDWTARMLRERPNVAGALRYRAASLALLGRIDEARQVIARILEQTPNYTIAEVRRHHEFNMNSPFKRPGVAESLYRGCGLRAFPNDRAAPPCRHRVGRRCGLLAADGPRRGRHAGSAESSASGSDRSSDQQAWWPYQSGALREKPPNIGLFIDTDWARRELFREIMAEGRRFERMVRHYAPICSWVLLMMPGH